MPAGLYAPPAALEPLREDLERLIAADQPESLWAAESVLARGIADGVFGAFANEIVAALARDPGVSPVPTSPLYRTSAFRFAMITVDEALVEKSGDEVMAHAQHLLLASLGPGAADVRLYERTSADGIEVFDPSARIAPRGSRRLHRGDILRVRAGVDMFRVAAVTGPTILIALFGPSVFETSTVYGENDGAPRRQYAGKLTTTRAQTALAVLSELNAKPTADLTDAVSSMLAHPAHAVRWAAANALSRISDDWRTVALDALREDPHPHVRAAVRRTMELDGRGA